MHHFIDRRLNPRDKNLDNRMRFLRRTREQIKPAVDKAVRERSIGDAVKGGSISIPSDGIGEPFFHFSGNGGDRTRILPGNKEFVAGDQIKKPKAGQGGSGRNASDSGEGEDPFSFAVTEEEFLNILFDDLELPHLVKASLKDAKLSEYRRAGYSREGTTPNLNVLRTVRCSVSRRLALRRPTTAEVRAREDELENTRRNDAPDMARVAELLAEIERLKRLQRAIPFIDPIDVRYNRFTRVALPRAKAVMFCLMDVSASMAEREKDLAKRFFILLHLFLKRKYDRVDIVFIRHTHEANEVDEQKFFCGKETGGTVVSSALEEMIRIRGTRYPVAEWNIYCAQASDGDNSGGDTERCVGLLQEIILPLAQYFAYIEIADRAEGGNRSGAKNGKELWRGYAGLEQNAPNFAMKQVAEAADIYPVFRELFAKQSRQGAKA
jgi:uncharacterized sporulation protein YeaH/YhbH (DUF444 family)